MDLIVKKVLEIDSRNRSKSLNDDTDLYQFSDLNRNLTWDYSLPTLTSGNSLKLIKVLPTFISKFNTHFPIKVCMDNLLIAGGCTGKELCENGMSKDIDFFFYGLTEQEANVKCETLLDQLYDSYKLYLENKQQQEVEKNPDYYRHHICVNCKTIRNNNCISIILGSNLSSTSITIQIILRIYKSKSEILHGFDIGSSAVGFDGTNVYFTELSKFSYEYSCNIVDTTRRSTTYERRLVKYWDRGFDIILPDMNTKLIRNVNSKYSIQDVCELPQMVFTYSDVKHNKIMVQKFLSYKGDDLSNSDYQIEHLDEYRIFYINLHNLVSGKHDFYFWKDDSDSEVPLKPSDIIQEKPYLSRREVVDYYDVLINRVSQGGTINIKMLRKYVKDITPILTSLLENTTDFNKVLAECINNEKIRVLKLVDNIVNADYPLKWLTKNPGQQLTSSFNPVFEDPKEWYGEYYSKYEKVEVEVEEKVEVEIEEKVEVEIEEKVEVEIEEKVEVEVDEKVEVEVEEKVEVEVEEKVEVEVEVEVKVEEKVEEVLEFADDEEVLEFADDEEVLEFADEEVLEFANDEEVLEFANDEEVLEFFSEFEEDWFID